MARVFPPDQTAELSTPVGRKPPRADIATAAESMPDGRSQHRPPAKVGVWELGAVINNRYELERRLGSGSMGEVFLARDRLLKKPVALKVLRGDMAKSRATVRRFLREVALAHSVTHPNVVRIYDTGETGGLPYFSMEFLQGQTLEQLIDVGRANRASRASRAARAARENRPSRSDRIKPEGDVRASRANTARLDPGDDEVELDQHGDAAQHDLEPDGWGAHDDDADGPEPDGPEPDEPEPDESDDRYESSPTPREKLVEIELGDPPMTLREIREISYEILSGLAAAHQAGIVHRDLKPANVMLTHRGAIVMDFGVAGFDSPTPGQRPNPAEARSLVRTEAGTIFGSPAYMAPELWEGAPATVQSDLYSFGVMLYQMLSGRLPIEAPNAKAFLIKLKEEKPAPIRQLRKDTPWNLALLVARCMDHDPDQRPVSADAAARLVAPLAGRWRWIAGGAAVLAAAIVAAVLVNGPGSERYHEMGLPDAVAEADLDAMVRSYDVGDYEAAIRQIERIEIRAPDAAAVVFWRATLEHELGNPAARWAHCESAGYDARTDADGEQWQGSEHWRELAMGACSASYSLSAQLRSLLDPDDPSKLPESWLPLAVSASLVPRLEAARDPGSSLMREAEYALRRLDEPPEFDDGPVLAIRWELARLEVRLALGRFDEVRNLLDDLLNSHPEAPVVLAWAANFYALSGELERAEDWARAVSPYDPRPSLRLLLDGGQLHDGAALIDRYVSSPGSHPHQQQLIDTWCGYAYRFELDVAPQRCGAVGPGLVHNLWIGVQTDGADHAAMNTLEKAIVTQQIGLNRGECLNRGANDSIIAHSLPPFETYLRQLDIAAALCFSGNDAGPDLDAARRLADQLISIAPNDPWAQLVDAQVDEARLANKSAGDKRQRVVARWRDADDNLPLVRAVRTLVGTPPSSRRTPGSPG